MRVLMIGPSRSVKGGISTLVNNLYQAELDKKVDLKYLGTMKDGSKPKKLFVAIQSFLLFLFTIKQYDVLHVHMASRASFRRKSFFIRHAKRLNKKIIIHLHGAEFKKYYHEECDLKQKESIRTIFGYADGIIALSNSWKDFLSTIADGHKVEVIYNCVPVPAAFDKNDTEKRLLFMGRIGNRKGVFDLLEIMPEIVEAFPEVQLSVGGDGDIKRLMESIQQLGLQHHVTYIGWVTDEAKEKQLMGSTIYLLPSYNEGLPMGLLEAMSYKCAVVTSNVGGIPEVICNGKNGYMVDPGNMKELKNRIRELLEDGDGRRRMGEQAYLDIVDQYSCDRTVEKLIRLYDALI